MKATNNNIKQIIKTESKSIGIRQLNSLKVHYGDDIETIIEDLKKEFKNLNMNNHRKWKQHTLTETIEFLTDNFNN